MIQWITQLFASNKTGLNLPSETYSILSLKLFSVIDFAEIPSSFYSSLRMDIVESPTDSASGKGDFVITDIALLV